MWLDRGELDKIIERSAGAEPPRDTRREAPRYDERSHGEHRPYRKQRASFLGELFDF